MKKILLASTLLLALFSAKTSAQVYEKGNIIFDAYVGGPNGAKVLVKLGLTSAPDVKVGGFGPVGIRLEYLLSKRVGIGLNSNYSIVTAKGTTTDTGFNPATGKDETKTYDYKLTAPRFRIMPTFNIHLGNSEKFDPYFSFGVGYSSFKLTQESNDPTFMPYTFNSPSNLALRAEFGIRYFFTDNIGIHGQFGIGGGPLVAGGLSLKF